MSFEWRGRVYADPHFAYSREDTVRGMFRFAKGAPIGDGLRWLKIHIANVGDFRLPDGRRVGKLSYADRIAWVDQHIEDVLAVRNWQKAAEPYRYPVGIPIIIDYRKPRYKQMTLPQLGINHFRKIGIEYTPGLDARRMRDGIVPNVVHACDASLVLMTASACAAEGIELATVHDCFSCLAPHARRMNVIVREQFVKLYTEHDVLAEIYEAAERAGAKNLPNPPERGTLDLNAVKRANYFLS
jgi:DNA-directed RNA polymerase